MKAKSNRLSLLRAALHNYRSNPWEGSSKAVVRELRKVFTPKELIDLGVIVLLSEDSHCVECGKKQATAFMSLCPKGHTFASRLGAF